MNFKLAAIQGRAHQARRDLLGRPGGPQGRAAHGQADERRVQGDAAAQVPPVRRTHRRQP